MPCLCRASQMHLDRSLELILVAFAPSVRNILAFTYFRRQSAEYDNINVDDKLILFCMYYAGETDQITERPL